MTKLENGGSGSGDQILQETIIDNPDEMEMLEEENDEDPETLEELDKR